MERTIGVLSLQGGYREHGAHLRESGVEPIYVNAPSQLERCVGLIIPGGESSCLRKLLRGFELDVAIVNAVGTLTFFAFTRQFFQKRNLY